MSVLTPKPKPPPKPPKKGVLYRPPPGLIDEVDEEARQAGLSRNEAITQLLRFALDAGKKKPKPR